MAIIRAGQEICLGQRTVHLRPNPALIDPEFLCYYLLTPKMQGELLASETGATSKHVNMADIRKLRLGKLPSLKDQRWAASTISSYDTLIENNRRRIQLLEESARLLYREWFVRLRFPGHERVRVVDGVPEDWQTQTLAELTVAGDGIQTGPFGSQLHQSDYSETGVPVVMPQDLIGFRISTEKIAYIPEALADKLVRHRMKVGDVVYGRRGDIGRRAFVSARHLGWFCGTGCLRLRPNPDIVVPRYFFDALGAPNTAGLIAGRAKGATMPNLNASIMRSIPILLPTRGLQQAYAELVEPIDSMIESLTVQNGCLRDARDLLLPKLMSGEVQV